MSKTRCNNCMRVFADESELILLLSGGEWYNGCPDCLTDQFLMDLDAEETERREAHGTGCTRRRKTP